VRRPAELDLQGKRDLALGQVSGERASQVRDAIRQQLMGGGYFTLVDPAIPAGVLADVHDADPPSASGHWLGASTAGAVLVTGIVELARYEERRTRQRETCERNSASSLVRTGLCYRHVRHGTASVAATFDIRDEATGAPMHVKRLRCQQSQESAADGDDPPPIDGERLVARCVADVVQDFMRTLAPWEELVVVSFEKDGDLPMLELGIHDARRGDWEGALAKFQDAVALATDAQDLDADTLARAHWDLGLAFAHTGSIAAATREIETAYALSPQESYRLELERLRAEETPLRAGEAAMDWVESGNRLVY
jgi:hypothetical protein